ncbi:MAG TPA: plastocyanin/azurin family copper-binding protein [Candidatus Limnocylindria bacterium]
MHPKYLILSTMLAALLVACAPGGEGAAESDGDARTVSVTMTDEFRFEPEEFTFAAGETVRFEVINSGAIVHEFLIGDEAAQAEFAEQMAGMEEDHDSAAGVSVEPGETMEFTYTFDTAGDLLAGCHEPGHYEAGMVATITVEP